MGKPNRETLPSAPTNPDAERDLRNEWSEEAGQPARRVVAANKLTGDRVRNSAGENLGKIEDLAIDISTGRIAYAVLSFGGFLNLGNKLFAIPWEALSLNRRDHEFVLNVDRRQLEGAPGFDKEHWPDMADRDWGSQVFAYYGYKPYWEGSAPLEPGKETTYMPQGQNQLVCEGCGKQFNNRQKLEEHRSQCAAVQAKQQQGRAGGKTRAMGSTMPPEDEHEG